MQLSLGKCGHPLVLTPQGWEIVPQGTILRQVEWPDGYFITVRADGMVLLHGCGSLSSGEPRYQARLAPNWITEINPLGVPRIQHRRAPLAEAIGRIPRRAHLASIGPTLVSVQMSA